MTKNHDIKVGMKKALASSRSKLIAFSLAVAVVLGSALLIPRQEPKPLYDDFAGMGTTPAAVTRDEIISVWEAWKRETVIEACMAQAGHEYNLQVHYPTSGIYLVAEALEVKTLVSEDDIRELNDSLDRVTISSTATLKYERALWGESPADIKYVEETGAEPARRSGDPNFARGGCLGQAADAIGSLWNLRKNLKEEYGQLDLKGEVPTEQLQQLEAQKEIYEDLPDEIAQDSDFKNWLSLAQLETE